MPKLTVESTTLENPKWPGASLKPGDTTTMQVDAPQIKPAQFIEFRIRQGDDVIDTLKGAAGKTNATWKVPNLPHSPKLKFDAVLKDKASPKTGFHAVLAKVTSPEADVKGFKVDITDGDAAFVPHTEKIQIKYTVTDPGGVAVKGRYEIWGERYPDDTPLYIENFTPAAGAKTWDTWDGKANQGKYNGKYMSPEFSPYRVRIVIGVTQGVVDDAFGVGISQVAAAERPFDVEFESVHIRLQAGIVETAAGAPANVGYTLGQVLTVEPYARNGNYRALGRLPLETEPLLAAAWTPGAPAQPAGPGVGRIRIPMACHHRKTDRLRQGGILLGNNYMGGPGAGGPTKNAIDTGFYTRPELPLEFEPRLRSRVVANNTDPAKLGLFEKEAVGPAKMEPVAEDTPASPTGTYPFASGLYAGGVNEAYWKNAAFKVKQGTHSGPVNSGAAGIPAVGLAANKPIVSNWQVRLVVGADGNQDFDLDNFEAGDTTYRFVKGGGELTVWLNRTRLVLGANEAEINKGVKDYIEVDNHTLKIRPGFTRKDDVLWIVRSDPANAVPNWTSYPPGTNCHVKYGGIRGAAPNNLFRKDYSAVAAGHEPQIGLINGAYPYKDKTYVNLLPDPVPAAQQERVEVTAMVTGAQQGLAGILFSPSFIAGDSYILHILMENAPYERNLGWIADRQKPRLDRRSGTLTVWRLMSVSNSWRLPNVGTAGLAAAVGCPPETAVAARRYIGDGVNMDFAAMNVTLARAFNEWVVPPPNPGVAPAADVHKDINLATYRTEYLRVAFAGQIPMAAGIADIKNIFVPYDHYRDQLPPNTPANRVNAASNAITMPVAVPVAAGGLAAGTLSAAAMSHVQARYTALEAAAAAAAAPGPPPGAAAADEALNGAATLLAVHPGPNPSDYSDYIDGVTDTHFQRLLDKLIPRAPQPKSMQVIRWPQFQDHPIWIDGAPPLADPASVAGAFTIGADFGDGQAFFVTETAPDTVLFPHEMGHSAHLAHYVAENFEWKHHHVLQPDCMMSYTYPTGFIVQPAVPAGPILPATPTDEGWPHRIPLAPPPPGGPPPVVGAPPPPPPLPAPYSIDPAFDPSPAAHGGGAAGRAAAAALSGTPCIRLDAIPHAHFGLPASPAPGGPCAKCMLKLRGWNDSVLPVAWKHPDLF